MQTDQAQPLLALHWITLITFGLSSFVMFEPAPFELAFLAVAALALFQYLPLTGRAVNVQFFCATIIFMALGAISIVDAPNIPRAVIYHAITAYMFLIFLVVALIFQSTDEAMKDMVIIGYLVGIFVAALLGAAEMFNISPTQDVFTKFDRLKGTYKDPNVFGPAAGLAFLLVLFWQPALPLPRALVVTLKFLFGSVIGIGVLLTYSRASQGQLVMATALASVLIFLVHAKLRVRPSHFLAAGGLAATGLFMVIFVAPLVLDVEFLASRLAFQWYDFDRFAIQALALKRAFGLPLGVGPGQSEIVFLKFASIQKTGATHNTYIRVLVENGWAAFVVYLMILYGVWFFVLDALNRLASQELKTLAAKRAASFVVITFVIYSIHLVMGMIIDTLHWRHFFILMAIALGASLWARRYVT